MTREKIEEEVSDSSSCMSDEQDMSEQEDISVDFKFEPLSDLDYHGLKHLFQQLFRNDIDTDYGPISDLVIKQGFGTVIKVNEDLMDPYAVLCLIDCDSLEAKPFISFLTAQSSTLSKLLDQSRFMLLINERLINMPPQLSPYLFEIMANELKEQIASNSIKPFDYFLYPFRMTFKQEDEFIEPFAIHQFEFSGRMVLVIPFKNLDKIKAVQGEGSKVISVRVPTPTVLLETVPTLRYKKCTSPLSPTSKISPLSPTGKIGHVMSKKPSSISFFIDLMSLDTSDSTIKSTTRYRFKPIHPLRPGALELKAALDTKMKMASLKRTKYLEERRAKLTRQAQAIKFRLMIHESRLRLEKLRLQAKAEYSASSAQLNRQIHLRKIREQFGSKVEHAKRVMLLQKMKKYMNMRRALSENFADLLKQDELDDFATESEARMSPLSAKVVEDDVASTSSIDKPFSSPYELSDAAKAFHRDYISDYGFAASPKTRSESLADEIRRTKSLPDLVLKDGGDSTFLDLLILLPPITRFNLRELEMDEILSNAQLRHDLLFDADLKFKATDADDEDAMAKTKEYWDEVRQEVAAGDLYRIPLLLAEVRAILIELLPSGMEQRDEIFSNIDTHLIAQQINHGIMNPTPLIVYVSNIMKTNCAPIRDVVVDRMVTECQSGDFVMSLQTCFEILELMKLDYANHQMSKLRPYIVQHAVEFEWKFFRNQLESGLISTRNTQKWLASCWERYKAEAKSPNPAYDLYPDAFMHLLSLAPKFSEESILPETFKYDVTRLVSFYNSWQDITILATILIIFKQVAGPKCLQDNILEAKKTLWILLNDSESTMSHITLQMAALASQVRGFPMKPKELTDLHTMTEKTLSPGSKLFELVQKRVGMHLETGISHQKSNQEMMVKHGLQALEQEISELIAKMVPVADINRTVYGALYTALIDEFKGI